MTLPTEAELDAMERIEDMATPTPWGLSDVDGSFINEVGDNIGDHDFKSADASFLLSACNNHGSFIAAVRELRAELETARVLATNIRDERDTLEREAETLRETLASVRAGRERERADGAIGALTVLMLKTENEKLRETLEWFADEGHYEDTYRHGAGFVDAVGLEYARAALAREPKPEGG